MEINNQNLNERKLTKTYRVTPEQTSDTDG